MRTRRVLPTFGLVFGGVLFTASAAMAATASAPGGGSTAYDSNNNGTFSVHDTACNSYGAYGYYHGTRDDDHRLNNHSGCGTTVSKSVSGARPVMACVNIPAQSDPCSSFVSN